MVKKYFKKRTWKCHTQTPGMCIFEVKLTWRNNRICMSRRSDVCCSLFDTNQTHEQTSGRCNKALFGFGIGAGRIYSSNCDVHLQRGPVQNDTHPYHVFVYGYYVLRWPRSTIGCTTH